ncbi:DUF418 domain-containing protein [Saccharopolyspora gloriosae]|uniref:DUF418 domain-containing protein n=1 Tax=Saccharopolyspora gloriosae TaxID=455344 RepID=UPI002867E071|nr:DUF418 domain-containing protein [Saccharopolyspora gloriosae]
MFGVGLELQYRSARRRGARWPGWYLWRAALLFVEGALHYVLIFEFDVLMSYAVTSVIVAYLIGRSDRAVRGWIIGCAAVHALAMTLGTAALLASNDSMSGPGSALFTDGTYLEQVGERLTGFAVYRLEALFIIPMSIAMFLIGSRLRRAGVFEADARGRRLRNRLMVAGLGVALPLNLLTTLGGGQWFLIDRYVLPPVVALGLLGLITTVVLGRTAAPGPLRVGITAVGRTALSGYVAQNLLAAILCYGWGFGLAARLDEYRPWWPIGLWAVLCATLMPLATWWLRRFTRGPLELAWHWAYQAPQRRT